MFGWWIAAALAATGAEDPAALADSVRLAIDDGAPWRLVDLVVPEDRDVAVASLDMGAGFAAMTGPEARAEYEEIHARFGVVSMIPSSDPASFAAAIETAYAGVTDHHGLAEALWGFMKKNSTASVSADKPPRYKGGKRPSVKFGPERVPIVQAADGRWYLDLPEPSLEPR